MRRGPIDFLNIGDVIFVANTHTACGVSRNKGLVYEVAPFVVAEFTFRDSDKIRLHGTWRLSNAKDIIDMSLGTEVIFEK